MPKIIKLWDNGEACKIIKEADPVVMCEWNPQTLEERQKWQEELEKSIADLTVELAGLKYADKSKTSDETVITACDIYNTNIGYTIKFAELAEKQALLDCLLGKEA